MVKVLTKPSGAKVISKEGNHLGVTGDKAIQFKLVKHQSLVQFRIVQPGYKTENVKAFARELIDNKQYPIDGKPLQLRPDGWRNELKARVTEHPVASLSTLIALGLGIFWGFRKKQITKSTLNRAAQLEEYRAAAPSSDSLILSVIGNYRIISELGKGGMATVYEGVPDATLNSEDRVAIKVLHRELATEGQHLERFHREIDTYRQLQHKNVVGLLDWGEVDGRFYVILEHVDGMTLEDKIEKERPENFSTIAHLLSEITDGIAYAHGQGVVHRDLKPSNIMLTSKGRIKLMDFGLAKSVDAGKMTKTGTVVGTPAYMAPEQIQSGDLNPTIDQYAFGCIAYELLTGRTPFVADDPIQLLFQNLSESPEPPSMHCSGLSAEVDQIVLKMLAKLPDERYSSVREAGEHLVRALT